jgi:hypothetical protein
MPDGAPAMHVRYRPAAAPMCRNTGRGDEPYEHALDAAVGAAHAWRAWLTSVYACSESPRERDPHRSYDGRLGRSGLGRIGDRSWGVDSGGVPTDPYAGRLPLVEWVKTG